MKWELEKATLIKRYKRFLGDVRLNNGQEFTLHIANTGAMTGCAEPGDTVWYSSSNNPKRKYPNSWELTQNQQGHFICVNTQVANKLVLEALENKQIEELKNYQGIQTEVKYGQENSRIDFKLSAANKADCFLEVKSVTLLSEQEEAQGYFPDAVTLRGQKHLKELMAVQKQGHKAVLLFLVMHTGIKKVKAAKHIDPKYAQLLKEAQQTGVSVLSYDCNITEKSITINKPLPLN